MNLNTNHKEDLEDSFFSAQTLLRARRGYLKPLFHLVVRKSLQERKREKQIPLGGALAV